MKLAGLVGVSLLMATSASAQSTAIALAPSARVTMKVVDAPFEDVVSSVGQATGITVQWGGAVSSEVKSRRVPSISFVNAPADDALAMLVRFASLAYTVIDAKTARITFAQQCLHGTAESAEQNVRRREALTATRTINNLQFNQPNSQKRVFFSHAQLADSPWAASMRANPNELSKRISFSPDADILPGWKLTLDLTSDGYWFAIKDTMDPCGFAYISNHVGVIYTAEPLR